MATGMTPEEIIQHFGERGIRLVRLPLDLVRQLQENVVGGRDPDLPPILPIHVRRALETFDFTGGGYEIGAPTIVYTNYPMVGNPVFDGNITSQANPAGSVSGRGGGGGAPGVYAGSATEGGGGDAPQVYAGSVSGRGGGDAPGVHPGSVTEGGGGDAPGVGFQLNDDMLRAARAGDENGGRFHVIQINLPPLQGSRATEDGPVDFAQRALQSAFGGIVPLCYTVLDDNLKGDCPGYIKAAAYTGLVLVTGFAFTGLISKKRTKAAVRVLASTCTAALFIAIVHIVSENVYIKSICGVIGAVATLTTMAINW